jgi:hypothetical protein
VEEISSFTLANYTVVVILVAKLRQYFAPWVERLPSDAFCLWLPLALLRGVEATGA